MELSVLNKEGKETGKKVVLSESVFGIVPNDHAIYLDIKLYHANQRQGTHKSKERNEVAGSTKKLKNQKVLVELVRVQLNQVFLLEEVVYSVHVQEIILSN